MSYPFVQAMWYTPGRIKPVRLIVIHDMEAPEKSTTAEAVARFFATTDRRVSAHFCVDNDSVVQCVGESDTAYHAAGANADGIGIEHAGYARQKKSEWLDTYGQDMLFVQSAKLAADLCLSHYINPVRLTVEQIRDGKTKGFCSHGDVSAAFPEKSTGHYDPGINFPWEEYLSAVEAHLKGYAVTAHRTILRGTSGPEHAVLEDRTVALQNQDEKQWLIRMGFVLNGDPEPLAPDDFDRWFGPVK